MTESWRHLPSPARPVAAATTLAVAAVRSGSRDDFEEAVAGLAALEAAHTGLILGTTLRLLLEDGNPDGLTADDVRETLGSCVRTHPEANPQVVLWLLAGALGVLDEDGDEAPKPEALARNAALLITDLLAGRELSPWLTAALTEIQHTQLND